MKRSRLTAAVVLAALLVAVMPAAATTLVRFSLAELVEHSDIIVEGRVLSTRCVRPLGAGIIYTEAVIEVLRLHKGTAPQRLAVRVPGGALDEIACHVAGASRFRRGETVLSFLDERHGRLWVAGMAQGKFGITAGPAGRLMAERDLGGATLVRRRAPAPATAGRDASVPAGALKAPRGGDDVLLGNSLPLAVLVEEIGRLVEAERAGARRAPSAGRAGGLAGVTSPGGDAGLAPPAVAGASAGEGVPSAAPVSLAAPDIGLLERLSPVLPEIAVVVGAILGVSALLVAVALRKSRSPARKVLVLVLAAGALFAGSAFGWQQTEDPFGSGVYLKWYPASIPVHWTLDTDTGTRTGLNQTDVGNALEAQYDKWQAVKAASITFARDADSLTPRPLTQFSSTDTVNRVFWATGAEDPMFGNTGVLGLNAAWHGVGDDEIIESDIGFNQYYTWKLTGDLDFGTTPWTIPVDSVALHEMGHVCGLDHSGNPEATMFYSWHDGSVTLHPDDEAGLAAIYPDTTAPGAPVITTPADDPHDNGSDPAVDIQGTCDADTETILVNGSTGGVTYTAGNTTWSFADGLTAPGGFVYSVVAADAAGNPSAADSVQIDYATNDPYVSSFSLADRTSAATAVTNSFIVNVSIAAGDDDGAVVKYLLKEGSTPPDETEMNSSGSDAAPGAFDLSASSYDGGERTVYCWVMDDDVPANISQTVSAAITVDVLAPVVSPQAEPLSLTSVLVRFSEAVQNADVPGSYSIAGAGSPSVTAASGLAGGDACVLTVSGLVAANPYTVTVSGAVTDLTGENAVASPYDTAAFIAAAGSAPTVDDPARDVNHTTTDVIFSEAVDEATATAVGNYRVLADTFTGTDEYAPTVVELIGPNVVRLHHFNTHDVKSRGVVPYVEKVAVRDVADLAGNAISPNPTVIDTFIEDDPANFYSAVDTQPPTVDSFLLRDPRNLDTTDTWLPTVLVEMTESDSGAFRGEVVRWYLSEDPSDPDEAKMLAQGSTRRPAAFTLSEGSGTRTVYAWVMDDFGKVSASASAGIDLVAAGAGPTADPQVSDDTIDDGDPAIFSRGSSAAGHPDGSIVEWFWDFRDDGNFSIQPDPTYTFTRPGIYDVELTVTDDRGATDTGVVTVTVTGDNTDPEVEIGTVTIRGRVDDPAAVTEVKLNDSGPYTVNAVSGVFSGDVPMALGANLIEIKDPNNGDAVIGSITLTRGEP